MTDQTRSPWFPTLPRTDLSLNDARSKLAGWHFGQESLSRGEREILYVAEAVLRALDKVTTAVDVLRSRYDHTSEPCEGLCVTERYRVVEDIDAALSETANSQPKGQRVVD